MTITRELSFEESCRLTAGATMWSTPAIPEAGVPSFTMADGPMGVASGNVDERDISLLTPCPTALGASWNTELVRRVGRIVGDDAVRRGVDAVLAPNLNLARSPLAGRAFEYFSEDPFLAGMAGAAWASGVQDSGTGSILKHAVCNDSETERDSMDVRVDERTLREVYLLPFEIAVEAGGSGILAAYNKVNGKWSCEQGHILATIIKDEWKFPYVVMSDWFATHSTDGCLNGGLDLEMPGPPRYLGPKAAEAVASGAVNVDRVRDAADRVSSTARKVTHHKAAPLARDEVERILVDAAAEGFVLLRNESGLLPLVPGSVRRIAVIGPNAAAPCYQGGTFAKIAVAPDTATPIDGIRARYGEHCEIVVEPGVDPQPRLPSMPAKPARDIGDGCAVGMTLDYFDSDDCSGEPLTSETRDTNSLVWFVGVHEQGNFDQLGSVRASGSFTPATNGRYRFYLGSTGETRLLVRGKEVLRTGKPQEAKDVMGILKAGEADLVEVDLEAGREVEVVVEFTYAPARVHGLWYGLRPPDNPESMLARAVEAAKSADAVFLIVGETSDSSVESKDRKDTRLPTEQLRLIDAVCAANPRTAVVVNVGHAFDSEWETKAAALLVAWYPGQHFASALASVLAGDREPGGRLPVSIARRESDYCGLNVTPDANGQLEYSEGTKLGYRGLIANRTPARHSFGSGFGYAQFELVEAAADASTVAVTVRNTSCRKGAEVVQLYRDEPECALVGFAKVFLGPNEERRVSIQVDDRMLRTWSERGWTRLERATPVRIARNAEDAGLKVNLKLSG